MTIISVVPSEEGTTRMSCRVRRDCPGVWVLVAFAALSSATAGCSVGNQGPEVAAVSGTVTLDGKPLPNASVLFQPIADSGKKEAGVGSYGLTDNSGRFTLRFSDSNRDGAVVGIHSVTIVEKVDQTKEPDAGPSLPSTPRSRIHDEYSNGSLRFEVTPRGSTTANFEIKSRE